jgi:hypothetical protein
VKFGYDKRLAHYASLVVSGQMTKGQARGELQKPLYDLQELEEDKAFWIKKLGISEAEYERVMAQTPSFYTNFENSEDFQNRIRSMARIAARLYRHFRPRK